MQSEPVLIAGATGYVGGRLIPRLLESGYRVRAMGRSLAKLSCRPWAQHPRVELVKADILDLESLREATKSCFAAFYLVHSMIAKKEKFAEADRKAAHNMVIASAEAGLKQIIYLGGLGDEKYALLSKHLKSRHEVAHILQSGPVPVTILRAAIILGSGSASFEILRYLVDRLPVMITPKWVHTPCQPIGIRNVLGYLQGCLENNETIGQSFDIGGPDITTYKELMDIYAEEAHLHKRLIIPVPWFTPHLSAKWIHLVTPVPSSIAIPLTEGLSTPVTCRENSIRSIIPQKLLSYSEVIHLALERVQQEQVDTCWADAGALIPPEWHYCGDVEYSGGTILQCGFRAVLQATPEDIWRRVTKIGGKTGWYYGDILWWLRGLFDRFIGGIGLRRGRRHPTQLFVGDALDFWRVLEVQPPHRLILLAEMKLPGEALLEIDVIPKGTGQTELQLLSRFLPRGLGGIVYWYVFYPFHELIFGGMLRSIAKSVGKPISYGPHRFTPKLNTICKLPSKKP